MTALPLQIAAPVQEALESGAAVVALESTIITHGMPYPENITTAQAVEADIWAEGAVPATIAVLDGVLHVGLAEAQLSALAQAKTVAKLSRADLPFALATGQTGSTTVAATMIGARLAGIEVFATGGIGGVHRGAETSFDISADLQELAQTPVTVVCAGAKAILDLSKTLEVLETLGVPVYAFGQDALPAFWARESGLNAPLRADKAADIARAHSLRRAMGLPGGQIVANPIPVADEIKLATLQPLIETALEAADSQGIAAKDVTPFLLAKIAEATGNATLQANIALVRNNARLAAQIAHELSIEQKT